jgi:hypothetical protein
MFWDRQTLRSPRARRPEAKNLSPQRPPRTPSPEAKNLSPQRPPRTPSPEVKNCSPPRPQRILWLFGVRDITGKAGEVKLDAGMPALANAKCRVQGARCKAGRAKDTKSWLEIQCPRVGRAALAKDRDSRRRAELANAKCRVQGAKCKAGSFSVSSSFLSVCSVVVGAYCSGRGVTTQ